MHAWKSVQSRFQQQLAARKYINRYQFFGWFLALALPFTLAMSLFIGWHNSVVDEVRPWHLLLRAAIGLAGYSAIIAFIFLKVLRPAIRRAEQEFAADRDEI